MKKKFTIKTIAFLLAAAMLISSCASTTVIQSDPSGARVYMNGERMGTTPYTHTDTKVVGSTTTIKLTKEGYRDFYGAISRNEEVDVGAIIGGVFFFIPFLWTMKYKPYRTFELEPDIQQ